MEYFNEAKMIFREAKVADIDAMHVVRLAVKENVLSNPALITTKDYEEYINERGKGWVCTVDNMVVGFAIADLKEDNIWALFVHPDREGKGIGKALHKMMMDWYFNNTNGKVWLSTAPKSRAAAFYERQGWKETGFTKSGEVKFEMTADDWRSIAAGKR